MMRKILITASIIIVTFAACKKNSGYTDTSKPSSGAKVKFINTSWNSGSLIFYGKDTTIKFSATAPATGNILTGIGYGSTYPSNDYFLIAAYNDSLKVRIPQNSAVLPGVFTGIGKLNIEEGKNYSVFVVDSFPSASLVVLDDELRNFNSILDTTFDVRFVNAIQGAPAVDVFSKNENAVIFSNVPYKGHTSFTNVRRNSVTTTDSIFVRLTGTQTVVGSAKIAFTPAKQRTYTWFARGRYGSTTAAPTLSFYTNQ